MPTREVTLRRHVGMLILQKFYKVRAHLCRDHGRQEARSWLGKTLILGWWGVISFFVNFVAVGTDVVAYVRASRLPEPRTPEDPPASEFVQMLRASHEPRDREEGPEGPVQGEPRAD